MAAWSRYGEGTEGEGRDLRIERIREALEEGRFRVDGVAVAGKIVDEAVRSLRAVPFLFPEEMSLPVPVEPFSADHFRRRHPGGSGQTK
jgi:ribosome maturation protein Sdo1